MSHPVCYSMCMIVSIKPTTSASQRTKNRIKERGPRFVVERMHDTKSLGLTGGGVTGLESWLLREVGGPDGDTWIGWIPLDEFEIVKEND